MVSAARVYQMLGNESLWRVARRCNDLLSQANIPYGVCGGVAVCLHGYQRNTVDVDLIIRPEDSEQAKQTLESDGFQGSGDSQREPEKGEFTTEDGFIVHFVIAGSSGGKGSDVKGLCRRGRTDRDSQVRRLFCPIFAQVRTLCLSRIAPQCRWW